LKKDVIYNTGAFPFFCVPEEHVV